MKSRCAVLNKNCCEFTFTIDGAEPSMLRGNPHVWASPEPTVNCGRKRLRASRYDSFARTWSAAAIAIVPLCRKASSTARRNGTLSAPAVAAPNRNKRARKKSLKAGQGTRIASPEKKFEDAQKCRSITSLRIGVGRNPLQAVACRLEILCLRQRGFVFRRGSGFVALLFEDRSQQVVRLEFRRLLG